MSEKIISATFQNFFSVLWGDWLARMSGGFSVPFGALAVWVDSKWASFIWVLLAASAFTLAAYRVWANERMQVNLLGTKLNNREKIETALSNLGEIRKEGVVLRGHLMGQLQKLMCLESEDYQKIRDIESRIVTNVAVVSQSEVNRFEIIDIFDPLLFPTEFQRSPDILYLSERLRRVDDFILRHQGDLINVIR